MVGAAHGSALAQFEAQVDQICAADPTADPAVGGSAIDGTIDFDITSWHFSRARSSATYPLLGTPCDPRTDTLYLVPMLILMLIGACAPMLYPINVGSLAALEMYTERVADPVHRTGLESLRHSLWRVIASMLNDRPQKCGLCRLVPPRAVCLPWLGRGWGEVGARLVRDCAPAPPCAAFNSDYSEH